MSRPPLDARVAAQIIHLNAPVYAEIEAQWAAQTAAAAASAAAASAAGSPARPQWQQQQPVQPQQLRRPVRPPRRPPGPDPQARSRSPVGRGSVAEAEASSANARASSPGGPTRATLEQEATELIALGAIEEERRRVEAAWMELLAQRLQRVLFMYRTAGTLEQIWEGIVSLVRHCEAEDEGAP